MPDSSLTSSLKQLKVSTSEQACTDQSQANLASDAQRTVDAHRTSDGSHSPLNVRANHTSHDPRGTMKANRTSDTRPVIADSWEDDEDINPVFSPISTSNSGMRSSFSLQKEEPPGRHPAAITTSVSSQASLGSEVPQAPPPTPASPLARSHPATAYGQPALPSHALMDGILAASIENTRDATSNHSSGGPGGKRDQDQDTEQPQRRPEKSTVVASRLIAAGLGIKAPKRTPEQREYDQAMRLQEKKRRDQAREEAAKQKAETERAKKAIWED